jgi:hypothetical protein
MKLRITGAAFLSVLAVTWITGCSAVTDKVTEKAAEKAAESAIKGATGADVDIDKEGNSIKVKNDKGDEMEIGNSEGKIPDGFPSDIPIYEGAKIVGNVKTSEGGKTNFAVTLDTNDDPSKVLEFYKGELENNGYKISSATEMGAGNAVLSFEKNGKGVGGVTISVAEGKTHIMLMVEQ